MQLNGGSLWPAKGGLMLGEALGYFLIVVIFGAPFGLACAVGFWFFNRWVNKSKGKT